MRGFAICMMIATHVASRSRGAWLLHLPFPAGSAADWFVLLSGVVLGIRAHRQASRGVSDATIEAGLLRRAGLLYVIHCAFTLMVVFLHERGGHVAAPDAAQLGTTMHALWLIATLQVQPLAFMNILPLYVVFLPMGALLVRGIRRGALAPILVASGCLWLLAQHAPSLIPLPAPATGAIQFSLAAWQFAFVVGLSMGWHWTLVQQRLQERTTWLAVLVTTAALFVIAASQRSTHVPSMFSASQWDAWFGKPTWAPGDAAYSVLLVSIVYTALTRWSGAGLRAPRGVQSLARSTMAVLQSMGHKSLQCFVLHLPLALAAAAWNTAAWPAGVQEVMVAGAIAFCYKGAQLETALRNMSSVVNEGQIRKSEFRTRRSADA